MQRHRLTPFLLLGLLAALASPATAQTSAAAQPSADQVIDRIAQAENELIERVRGYRPIVEAYIQEIAAEKDGLQLPMFDSYFLGRLEWQEGPVLALMANTKRVGKSAGERRGFLPDGFASMAAPDWKSMDRARYDFKLVRREFLGEVRTMVFDVVPRQGAERRILRSHLGRGSRLQHRSIQRREPQRERSPVPQEGVPARGRLAREFGIRPVAARVHPL